MNPFNTYCFVQDVLTRLSENVANSGNQYLNQLTAIANNIMSFDEHQQSSGNQYTDDLKKIAASITELDTNSQTSLADILKGLEKDGINTNDVLSRIVTIATNIKNLDDNNKGSLDKLSENILKSIGSSETSFKDALAAMTVKLGSNGDQVVDYMEHIVDNLKLIDQNNHAFLDTIGTNIQQGGINSREELQKIGTNIKDSTASLDSVVTNLQSLKDASKTSMDGLSSGLMASLASLSGDNKV